MNLRNAVFTLSLVSAGYGLVSRNTVLGFVSVIICSSVGITYIMDKYARAYNLSQKAARNIKPLSAAIVGCSVGSFVLATYDQLGLALLSACIALIALALFCLEIWQGMHVTERRATCRK